MIVVVADTGPVNYLIQTGDIAVLPLIAGRIVLPALVHKELTHEKAPSIVRAWASHAPEWVEIRTPTTSIEASDISEADRQAIALARELKAAFLLMDDARARRWASHLGVKTIGTLGLIAEAARRQLLSLPEAIQRLTATSFYVSEELIRKLLHRSESL